MAGEYENATNDISAIAGLENQLVTALKKTSRDLAHIESLDGEQRAEIYSILQAMKVETESDRATVEMLLRRLSGEVANA